MNIVWSKRLDRALLGHIANGVGVRGAARIMNISENAAIARYNRIRGVVFQSDTARKKFAKLENAKRRRERDQREHCVIKEMLESIQSGSDRNQALRQARQQGVRLRIIGENLGISRERVRQVESAS